MDKLTGNEAAFPVFDFKIYIAIEKIGEAVFGHFTELSQRDLLKSALKEFADALISQLNKSQL